MSGIYPKMMISQNPVCIVVYHRESAVPVCLNHQSTILFPGIFGL